MVKMQKDLVSTGPIWQETCSIEFGSATFFWFERARCIRAKCRLAMQALRR
jgi:hypothetical protein